MGHRFLAILHSLLAVAVGYIVMSLAITVFLELWIGGVSYIESSRPVLLLAGVCVFTSATAGGYLAGWIAGRYPRLHALAMTVLAVAETTWLITTSSATDPIWFELLAALNLILGINLGGYMRATVQPRR